MNTKTITGPDPGETTRAEQAAALVADLRRRGARITLHPDGRGFGVKTPPTLPIDERLDSRIYFFGEEIIAQLCAERAKRRRKKNGNNGDLALKS